MDLNSIKNLGMTFWTHFKDFKAIEPESQLEKTLKSSEALREQIQKVGAPYIEKGFDVAKKIGAMAVSPGTEIATPAIQKYAPPSIVPFAPLIGLGLDIAAPLPGAGEKKAVEKITTPTFQRFKNLSADLFQEARKYKTLSESKFGVRYGEEIKDKAIQLYKEGKSSTQISGELGISNDSVLSWTEKAGIKRTISQSKLLYEKDIPKVIELYKQGKNTTEISKELDLVPSSVARWVKEAGITRSNSEAQSILAELGKTNVLGVRSKVSTKFGVLPADSTYEAIRIKQLESDPNIINIKRATRIPFGENKHYVPDIEIKYKDGSTIIEEIKPVYKLGDEKIIAKEKAAKEFYKDKNIEYRLITENDIGVDAFKNANIDDFTFGSEEIKTRFANAIKKAQVKTKSQLTDIWNKANAGSKIDPLITEARKYKSAEEFVKDKAIVKSLLPKEDILGPQARAKFTGEVAKTGDTIVDRLPKILDEAIKIDNVGGDGSVGNYASRQVSRLVKNGKLTVYHGTTEKTADILRGNVWSKLNDGSYLSLTRTAEREAPGVYGAGFYKNLAEKYGQKGEVLKFEIPIEHIGVDKTTGELRFINPNTNLTKSQLTDIWNKAKLGK